MLRKGGPTKHLRTFETEKQAEIANDHSINYSDESTEHVYMW